MIKRFILWTLALTLLIAPAAVNALADSFALPTGAQTIEDEAFRGCESLIGPLVIPQGVSQIGAYAFAGCTGLTGLPVFPDSMTSIGAHAFDGCSGLAGVLYIPETVQLDATAFAGCAGLQVDRKPWRVCVIGDDEEMPWAGTLNYDVWSAVSSFCAGQGIFCVYGSASTALSEQCNVVISIGIDEGIADALSARPEIRMVCLDAVEESPSSQMYCVSYQTAQAGFMAGYAAVKMGYRSLGFLGGMSVPDVVNWGQGFVRGADAAAAELGVTDDVSVAYTYSGVFWPDDSVYNKALSWYRNGVEVIFCCGGDQCQSVAQAARETGGLIIGCDTDQTGLVDDQVISSSMKAMGFTAVDALEHIVAGNWEQIGGASPRLGVVSSTPSQNHVQLSPSTAFNSGFTASDYAALVDKIFRGTYDMTGDAAIKINDGPEHLTEEVRSWEAMEAALRDIAVDEIIVREEIVFPAGTALTLNKTLVLELEANNESHFLSIEIPEGASLTLGENGVLEMRSSFDPDHMQLTQLWLRGGSFDAGEGQLAGQTNLFVSSGSVNLRGQEAYMTGGALNETDLIQYVTDSRFQDVFVQADITLNHDITVSRILRLHDNGTLTVAQGYTLTIAEDALLEVNAGSVLTNLGTIDNSGSIFIYDGAALNGNEVQGSGILTIEN